MAWDPQGYYQQPYDPNQTWYQDQYYDPYADYGYYQDVPQEDTESEKLRKDQAEKERIEAIESNRLYLKKVRKKCVKEDFVELEQLQLFLLEVLIEELEVESDSVLGLVADDQDSYVTARVQFLNAPYLEICEKDMRMSGSPYESDMRETEYFQAIGEAGLREAYENPREQATAPTVEIQEDQMTEPKNTIKWVNASGKSCLFSMTPLQMIQDLDRFPVNFQVARCTLSQAGVETCEPLGYTQVRLPDHFSLSVLQSCKTDVILPVSCIHRETCELKNIFGVKKGKLEIFVRLSCFGPVIITSFQTVGADRRYVFKPSPMSSYFKEQEDKHPQIDALKPIITEEETTCGISVQKELDIFQKPVMWKSTPLACGCVNKEDFLNDEPRRRTTSQFASKSSLRLPLSSQVSLCRDAKPAIDNLKQSGKTLCDWHNLVSLEINNSPGGNCGCLNPDERNKFEKDNKTPPKISKRPSRLQKMRLPPSSTDLGRKPDDTPDTDCGCDCPRIKELLQSKKLFLI